ncbi:MAG: alpha/beta hydrolase [Magnetococcales bacterium]|nr:alpha/beta hydrolase [Magnetococcales bacterium]
MFDWSWVTVIIAGVGVFYLLACLHLYMTQRRKVFRVQKEGVGTPHDWGIDYEPLIIDNRGQRLSAWWIPGQLPASQAPKTPVILFCHGNGVTIHHLAKHVLYLRPLGGSMLVFDYQGYGNSDGRVEEDNMISDTLAAWRHLVEQRRVNPETILVYGHSLGGGPATWLAAHYVLKGVILEGTFTSIPDVAADHYPWLPVRLLARIAFDNLSNMPKISVPVFITHSIEDEIVQFHHAERLFASVQAPKRLLPIRGRHYDAFVQSGRVGLEALSEFFEIQYDLER